MARRTRILTDVAKVAEESAIDASPGGTAQYANLEGGRRKRRRARRFEALSLKLAGVSTAQIAERMGAGPTRSAS